MQVDISNSLFISEVPKFVPQKSHSGYDLKKYRTSWRWVARTVFINRRTRVFINYSINVYTNASNNANNYVPVNYSRIVGKTTLGQT